jgi:hypothetical protein
MPDPEVRHVAVAGCVAAGPLPTMQRTGVTPRIALARR